MWYEAQISAPGIDAYGATLVGIPVLAIAFNNNLGFSNPVRAMALTSYGNATQPGSPHISDQLQMFANKKLRFVWRDRSDILAHLEVRKVF